MNDNERESIKGKVAIVTGGGRGLGRATSVGLAQAGVFITITSARNYDEIVEVANKTNKECKEERIFPLLADVTKPEECEKIVKSTVEKWGKLDILVNNAGRGMKFVSDKFFTEPTRFWETKPDVWKMIIDTNVNGPFLMSRAAVPFMLPQHSGRIINISMNHETMRRKGFSPYGPSKAALESETIIWAQDLEGTGITVNALLPGGATLTGMIPPNMDEKMISSLLRPEIMVKPLLWLVSSASDGITGRRIVAKKWIDEDPSASFEDAGWALDNT